MVLLKRWTREDLRRLREAWERGPRAFSPPAEKFFTCPPEFGRFAAVGGPVSFWNRPRPRSLFEAALPCVAALLVTAAALVGWVAQRSALGELELRGAGASWIPAVTSDELLRTSWVTPRASDGAPSRSAIEERVRRHR